MRKPNKVLDIKYATVENNFYRNVVKTTNHLQIVLMCLKPEEEIEMEVHKDTDQYFRVEKGRCVITCNGKNYLLKKDQMFVVPQGSNHRVLNPSTKQKCHLNTIYSPPHHPPNKLQKTK